MAALVLILAMTLGQSFEGRVGSDSGHTYLIIRKDDGKLEWISTYFVIIQWDRGVVPRRPDQLRTGARVRVDRGYNTCLTVLDNFDDEPFGIAQDAFVNAATRGGGLTRLDQCLLLGLGADRYWTRQITHEKVARERRRAVVYRGLSSRDAETRARCQAILWSWTDGLVIAKKP